MFGLAVQTGRFGVVGALNTLIDFGTLNLLMWVFGTTAGIGLVWCNAVAFTVASLNSYFLNKRWTFEEKGRASSGQYLLFLTFSVGGLAVNSLVLYLLTTALPLAGAVSPVLWANVAKVCATAASMVWNYVTYRQIVFRKRRWAIGDGQ